MEISNLLTSSYYDAERVLQNKIDIGRSTNTERTEKGVEGRGEFISQDTYDKLSGLRFQMGGYEMQRITDRLSASEEEGMSTIASLSPSLANKDWGYSINENDELVVIEGEDKLSKSEQEIIKLSLEDAGVTANLEDFAKASVLLLGEDRGVAKFSTGLGRYDLNRTNFAEVVNVREVLETNKNEGAYDSWKIALGNQLEINGGSIDVYSSHIPFHVRA